MITMQHIGEVEISSLNPVEYRVIFKSLWRNADACTFLHGPVRTVTIAFWKNGKVESCIRFGFPR